MKRTWWAIQNKKGQLWAGYLSGFSNRVQPLLKSNKRDTYELINGWSLDGFPVKVKVEVIK